MVRENIHEYYSSSVVPNAISNIPGWWNEKAGNEITLNAVLMIMIDILISLLSIYWSVITVIHADLPLHCVLCL